MNKKGVVFTRPRDTMSFFIGLFVAVVGLFPLLKQWGLIGFSLPFIENIGAEMFIWLVAIFGAYVLIDGLIEPPMHSLHWVLIIAGGVMMLTGLLPLLNNFGLISLSLDFLTSNVMIYRILLSLEGISLVIGGLTMH